LQGISGDLKTFGLVRRKRARPRIPRCMTEHITDRRVAVMREIEGKRGSIILPPVLSRRSGESPGSASVAAPFSGERGEWTSLGNCGIRRELAVENALGEPEQLGRRGPRIIS
jgi:hypothetical protein